MKGLMRDTAFGQIVRVVSGRRFFKYSEEENHELWKQFIDEKKSANLAQHGTVEPPEDGDAGADAEEEERQGTEVLTEVLDLAVAELDGEDGGDDGQSARGDENQSQEHHEGTLAPGAVARQGRAGGVNLCRAFPGLRARVVT